MGRFYIGMLWMGIFSFGFSCKKQAALGNAYSLDAKNAAVQDRLQACTQKGAGYVFQNEVCYNPEIAVQQEAACKTDTKKAWDAGTMACVPKLQLAKVNCLLQGVGFVWGNQECYLPTEEKPGVCKDENQAWDGVACVDATSQPNYYRYCISHSLSAAGKKTVTVLESVVGKSTCQDSFTALAALTSLDLSGKGIVEIAPLFGFSALTAINLSNNQLSDGAVLTYLSGLKTLNISNNRFGSFSFLQGLTGLESLGIQKNPAKDYQYLFHLPSLQTVDVPVGGVPNGLCAMGVISPAFVSLCAK